MTKIFVSNTHVALPGNAVKVCPDMIDPAMLEIMCANYTPITYSTIDKSGLWMDEHCIYALIPGAEGDDRYYRVMLSWM